MAGSRASPRAALSIAALVAAVTFCVAYDDGGYSLTSRSTLAIAVWWAIGLGVALGVLPLSEPIRAAFAPGLLLAAFALWALLSAAWADSAENAYAEFDRSSLYLGIYVLVVLTCRTSLLESWLDGLAAGIVATCGVALCSRLVPGSFPGRGLAVVIPSAGTRLSFPIGYWNGLGTFAGLGFPLLVHSALRGGRGRRLISVGLLPLLGVTVYLTSSRAAVAATAVGVVVLIAAHPDRPRALLAALAGAAGAAIAIAAVASRHAVVDGPLGSSAARVQGREAVVAILVACVLTAVAHEWLALMLPRLPVPGREVRRALLLVIVAALVAAAVAEAHSFRGFTRLPTGADAPGTVGTHLLSGSGNGRWQFWSAALDEFRSYPIGGGGAGSFASWWTRHGSFSYSIRNAHSLFLETLAELGLVGLALLLAVLGTALVTGVRRLRAASGARQGAIAALLGALTVYLLGAAVDWMWQLTAVTGVAVVMLGLLTGPASAPETSLPRRARGLPAAAIAAAACAFVVAEAILLLSSVEVARSQADARAGKPSAARAAAIAATRLEPWAAGPYLQLALVDESQGSFGQALVAIDRSLARDRDDWRIWLAKSRIENGLGLFAGAARSLARARALNPRSEITLQL